MPSPETTELADDRPSTGTRFPAPVDADRRFEAVVARGRSLRRRRFAGRGGAVLGAAALIVVALVGVTGLGDRATTVVSEDPGPTADQPTVERFADAGPVTTDARPSAADSRSVAADAWPIAGQSPSPGEGPQAVPW